MCNTSLHHHLTSDYKYNSMVKLKSKTYILLYTESRISIWKSVSTDCHVTSVDTLNKCVPRSYTKSQMFEWTHLYTRPSHLDLDSVSAAQSLCEFNQLNDPYHSFMYSKMCKKSASASAIYTVVQWFFLKVVLNVIIWRVITVMLF